MKHFIVARVFNPCCMGWKPMPLIFLFAVLASAIHARGADIPQALQNAVADDGIAITDVRAVIETTFADEHKSRVEEKLKAEGWRGEESRFIPPPVFPLPDSHRRKNVP